ncbi:MAG TPA: alpha/beta hydrolase-fold protein [Puia sp.]|nr:alpha/beta hydrolase-fold protein [Puia sp.]
MSSTCIRQECMALESEYLARTVMVDFYLSGAGRRGMGMNGNGIGIDDVAPETSLLLINDGQELGRMGLAGILEELDGRGGLGPLLCVGIHAGAARKMEYGTAGRADYQGWGKLAGAYSRFVMEELIPAVRLRYGVASFKEKAFAGFSLGALSAMDIVWRNPREFARVGCFSGSFWWRTKDKSDPAYDEARDRIMHEEVRKGGYYPWLKFFFECGTADEQEDRNHNGVIDSIDDTQDLIAELVRKGYDGASAIRYLEIADGKHDVETWARAMPAFLLWGWGK